MWKDLNEICLFECEMLMWYLTAPVMFIPTTNTRFKETNRALKEDTYRKE